MSNVYIVRSIEGEDLVTASCFARALWIMNRLEGAHHVVRDDGVLLATRTWVTAPTVSQWMMRLS